MINPLSDPNDLTPVCFPPQCLFLSSQCLFLSSQSLFLSS